MAPRLSRQMSIFSVVFFVSKSLLGMGDFRKYPYHTTGGILEFRGRVGVSWTGIPNAWGEGVTQFGIPKAWGGGFSSEFSEFPEGRWR